MASVRTLDDLRDIHLPPPPGEAMFDPLTLALGVALVVAVLALLTGWFWRRRVLRQSLRELAAAERSWRSGADAAELLRTASRLLRRHALRYDRRAAALVGEDWLAFLGARSRGDDGAFRQGPGSLLADAPYRPQLSGAVEVESVMVLVRRWLRSNP